MGSLTPAPKIWPAVGEEGDFNEQLVVRKGKLSQTSTAWSLDDLDDLFSLPYHV